MPTASTGVGAAGSVAAPLQHVANRPIVCHVLEQLQHAGVDEVALVAPQWGIGQLQAAIDADAPLAPKIVYTPYGSGGVIGDALRTVTEIIGESPCLVHAADGLLTQPLSELIGQRPADDDADMVAYIHLSADGSAPIATRRLLKLLPVSYQPDPAENAPGASPELVGVCLFGPGAIRRIGESCWLAGETIDPATIGERFVKSGARLAIESTSGWLHYRGATAELLAINRFLLDKLEPTEGSPIDDSNRLEGCVIVHPTASVQSSTIVGPAIVGPNALVLSAYVGPYTSIGGGSHIEGVEIERSIILPGARITHIGGRLVGSVVGRDARIFRDFSLPRAIRLNVGDGDEVALC